MAIKIEAKETPVTKVLSTSSTVNVHGVLELQCDQVTRFDGRGGAAQTQQTDAVASFDDDNIEAQFPSIKANIQLPVKVSIKWRIEEFERLMTASSVGDVVESESITSALIPQAIIKLKVYPSGRIVGLGGGNQVVAIFFNVNDPKKPKEKLSYDYHFYLLDEANDTKDTILRAKRAIPLCGAGSWGMNRERVRNALQANGSLVVGVDLQFSSSMPANRENYCMRYVAGEDKMKANWAKAIGDLINDEASCDCTLMVGNEMVKAHRNILCARSNYFKTAFGDPSFEEAQSGVIRVSDFSLKAVKAILSYIYRGYIDPKEYDECEEEELLMLAGKYELRDLKENLEERVATMITEENFFHVATFADSHACQTLLNACRSFLYSHYDSITGSEQWDELEEEYPKLALELVKKKPKKSA